MFARLAKLAGVMRRQPAAPAPPALGATLRQVMECVDRGDLGSASKLAASLANRPDADAVAAYAHALICEASGDLRAAANHAATAMRAAPDEPVYWLKCAQLDAASGQHGQAAAHYARLVALADAPFASDPDILFEFAAASQNSGNMDGAVGLLERVLELQPTHAQARSNLAMLLALSARGDEARAQMNILLDRADSVAQRLKRALMLPAIHESGEHISQVRERFSRELDELADLPVADIAEPALDIGLVPFMLAYQGSDNTALLRKFAQVVRRHYPAAGRSGMVAPPGRPRIRVGFLSRHFHAHSVARTTHGLIHDLPRERFEVIAYAIEPRADPWAHAIRESAESHVALPADPAHIRATLEEARLDVLIFADIGMEPLTYYLAFWRFAPFQMTTWGHPVTSGIDTIDYYLSAASLETEGADLHYTERLVRLPGYFMPRYRRPVLDEPRRSRPDALLNPDRTTYFCAQTAFKLHPEFDPALLAILDRDPRAEILLMETTREMGLQTRRRLERTLGRHARRVRMLPPLDIERFLRMQADADVLLDPFHFGGCNSTCEALGLGAPIVTLPGTFLAGRFTRASYEELGLDALVAADTAHYVELAVRLGTDRAFRDEISAQIRARQPRLFERPDAGQALGRALEDIVRNGIGGRQDPSAPHPS